MQFQSLRIIFKIININESRFNNLLFFKFRKMAKIEMDMSEYEAMKKVEKLLEESLQREKEMSLSIELLQKEKIKVMEQNKKSVTIIEEKRTEEIVSVKVSERQFGVAIENIFRAIKTPNSSRNYSYQNIGSIQDVAIEKLFTKTTIHDCPSRDKKVVYKGLDEVIDRITKEVKESIDKETQNSLSRLKELDKTHIKLKEDLDKVKGESSLIEEANITLRGENTTLKEQNKSLDKEIKGLSKEFEKKRKQVSSISDLINEIEGEVKEMNLFNKRRKKSIISNLIINWEDK